MFSFFLWSIGVLIVVSIIINYIFDVYYAHSVLMRTNQVLLYLVAIISAVSMFAYASQPLIFKISLAVAIISSIKSFLYYRVYKLMKDYQEAEENIECDEEENGKNEED